MRRSRYTNNRAKTMWLLKKEVKSVMRSRWLILGFIISPLFAWLFQGAFLTFIFQQAVEPEQVFITMEDEGPWGQFLTDQIAARFEVEKTLPDNEKWLFIDNITYVDYQEGLQAWNDPTAPVWLYIPANFSTVLETYNVTVLTIYVNAGSFRASAAYERLAWFSTWNIRIITQDLAIQRVTPPTPEASYGHQLAIFLVMITSVLAPAPYVSKSFAGERERHTLEALLVVPMSRLRILGAKLFAGMILTMIYSFFTVVGILSYNALVTFRAEGSVNASSAVNFYAVDPSTIPLIFFCQFLVLLCAIGIGVVISCLAKDQATSESLNNLVLLVPTMVIGILGFTGSILSYGGAFGVFVWLIPFSHAIMFLNGVLSGTATAASLFVNVAYMLGFTLVFLIIGAKAFEREAIIA